MSKFLSLSFFIIVLFSNACTVSLVNIGVDYSKLKTFSMEQFETKAANAPPTSGQQFSERLKNNVLNNTRLSYVAKKGDVHFRGNIIGYTVKSLAPKADQTVALQRLTMQVNVEYKNIPQKDGSADWSQTFSRFADFGSDQDLASVEEQLIQDIYDQILEDVFNKAFSGW